MTLSYNSITGSGQQRSYNAGSTANRPANPVAGELYYDTTIGGLMIYNGQAWSTFLTPAAVLAPTGASAINQGSNRPYNNGQASISFTPSSELGGAAALYTVTSTPGSITATGTSSPIVVAGLQSNTSYTFTVRASNSYSNATSSSTSPITATTVPDAPVIGTATDSQSSGTISIPITSQNTGGSAITNYSYSIDGINYIPLSPAQTSGPIVISGLTNNQAYTFRLKAINANGSSEASSVSNSVTPTAPYVLAQTFNASGSYTIPAGTNRLAVYVIGGGQAGTQEGPGGAGGSGAGVIINNPSAGTTYNVTVGGGGTGNAGFGGASSFGTLINSAGTGNASGIVAGNGGGTGGAAGNSTSSANVNANSGQPGNAGGNIVLTNSAGFGIGLPNAIQYGGGGGGGGGGNFVWQRGARDGGAGGSPFGGAGGYGGGPYDAGGYTLNSNPGPGSPGQTGGGGGGGSGRRGNAAQANAGAGGGGRVLVYTKS